MLWHWHVAVKNNALWWALTSLIVQEEKDDKLRNVSIWARLGGCRPCSDARQGRAWKRLILHLDLWLALELPGDTAAVVTSAGRLYKDLHKANGLEIHLCRWKLRVISFQTFATKICNGKLFDSVKPLRSEKCFKMYFYSDKIIAK